MKDELWENCNEEEIDVACWVIERSIMPQIFNLYVIPEIPPTNV